MSGATKGVLAACVVALLWYVGVYRPLADSQRRYIDRTERVLHLYEQAVEDNTSVTDRRVEETNLIEQVGYKKPTSTAEQESRMIEQIETACAFAGVGLVEIVRMEPEVLAGPMVTDPENGEEIAIQYLRHPVQVQTIGELEGTVHFLALLRHTSPMMMLDRMTLTADDQGLMRMRCVISSLRPDLDALAPRGDAA